MADPAVKTCLALCVVLAGVCGAMLFRNGKPPDPDMIPQVAPDILLRCRGEGSAPASRPRQRRAAAPVAETPASSRPLTIVKPLDRNEPPPVLAADFPATERASAPRRGASMEMMLPATSHRIVDGDTLPELAHRYLGSADRAKEIFDLNRDVLQNADLLPIGVELKLPPRGAPRPPELTPVP